MLPRSALKTGRVRKAQIAEMQRQVREALERSDKNNLEVTESLRECKVLCAQAEAIRGGGSDAGGDTGAVSTLKAQLEGEIAQLKTQLSSLQQDSTAFRNYIDENRATE